MKVMAFARIGVRQKDGSADPKSHIAPGDLCEVSDKTLAGFYPVTYPTARGAKTRWVPELTGFLCNQNAYGGLSYPAPGYPSATVKSGGCGVCAAVNAIGALCGRPVPVREMRDAAVRCGARVSGGTDMRRLTAELCRQYGLVCAVSGDVSALTAHLKAGGVAICNTAGRGMFSTGGHYVTALGLLDGRLCIADPGMYPGKYNSPRRRAAVGVSGDLVLASPATLDADCAGRYPRYYLLSRK